MLAVDATSGINEQPRRKLLNRKGCTSAWHLHLKITESCLCFYYLYCNRLKVQGIFSKSSLLGWFQPYPVRGWRSCPIFAMLQPSRRAAWAASTRRGATTSLRPPGTPTVNMSPTLSPVQPPSTTTTTRDPTRARPRRATTGLRTAPRLPPTPHRTAKPSWRRTLKWPTLTSSWRWKLYGTNLISWVPRWSSPRLAGERKQHIAHISTMQMWTEQIIPNIDEA